MGGLGAVAEPLVVVFLLFGGTWLNRNLSGGRRSGSNTRSSSGESARGLMQDVEGRPGSPALLGTQESKWRERTVGIGPYKTKLVTPNTRRFKDYFLSRLLERFPFLVECWYWALIYWVYQLGRAASAVLIVEGTVNAARKHALQVIAAEQRLRIFWELHLQHYFLQHPFMMTWINRTYSFIHIPGSIAFLVWLFYYTHTLNRADGQRGTPAGPRLFQARRRTMALCNLLAFIIFTAWPCMPPRLLSDPNAKGADAKLGRTFGFKDTVHGPMGEGSIWTDNKFTNKFAAMPSLHFGYSLLIGLTVATIPLACESTPQGSPRTRARSPSPSLVPRRLRIPCLPCIPPCTPKRLLCVSLGIFYPTLILIAILATANHFLLDAMAGATVCGVAWYGNGVMLNLCALEDWFLWLVRIHKPGNEDAQEGSTKEWDNNKGDWLH